MRNAWIVAKRELYAYLVSPVAYGVAAAFLLLCGLFFVGGVAQWQDANLQSLFASLSIVLLFVAPLLTMSLLAREQDQGTIELLLTAPLRDWEVVLGKFLASYLFYLAMIAVTGLYVPIVVLYGTPDLGIVGAGYLGLALLGAALLSLGLFTSSLDPQPGRRRRARRGDRRRPLAPGGDQPCPGPGARMSSRTSPLQGTIIAFWTASSTRALWSTCSVLPLSFSFWPSRCLRRGGGEGERHARNAPRTPRAARLGRSAALWIERSRLEHRHHRHCRPAQPPCRALLQAL